MVCVFSYKTSMRNVTPCVSIVSCLKFVRLNAQFIRFYNPFVIVNAQKEAIMIHEKTFVRLNALCLSSKFTKVHLILQFTEFFTEKRAVKFVFLLKKCRKIGKKHIFCLKIKINYAILRHEDQFPEEK